MLEELRGTDRTLQKHFARKIASESENTREERLFIYRDTCKKTEKCATDNTDESKLISKSHDILISKLKR